MSSLIYFVNDRENVGSNAFSSGNREVHQLVVSL